MVLRMPNNMFMVFSVIAASRGADERLFLRQPFRPCNLCLPVRGSGHGLHDRPAPQPGDDFRLSVRHGRGHGRRAEAEAIHHARKSLPQFLALARHPRPSMTGFSVKIALLAKNGFELFWIHPFAHVDERFIGQINNTLRSAMTLKLGDTISFLRNEIVDWMYIDGGA